ncbi:MAG: rhodanese-like domain-containing protein [Lachnospiraceae bacterium]|nr:rhodanese-like domain-containing protein [Lachnospiraceae bacterium]MDD3659515.1 rhodanese-like domain-containing protein [Lachnospiraceae bacterium]
MKKKNKIFKLSMLLAAMLMIGGCAAQESDVKQDTEQSAYTSITAEEAKKIMDEETGYLILDVRTKEEYDEGHIPDSVLLPNETIDDDVSDILPDKDQKILIYCRSGNRSKQASQKLADLGYTDLVEFGGIIDWPYEIEVIE